MFFVSETQRHVTNTSEPRMKVTERAIDFPISTKFILTVFQGDTWDYQRLFKDRIHKTVYATISYQRIVLELNSLQTETVSTPSMDSFWFSLPLLWSEQLFTSVQHCKLFKLENSVFVQLTWIYLLWTLMLTLYRKKRPSLYMLAYHLKRKQIL